MSMPERHQRLLADQLPFLNEIDHCITNNAEFLEDVATHAGEQSLLGDGGDKLMRGKPKPKVTEHEMEKVRSTLRQLHRDWSEEGRYERDITYKPVLEALEDIYGQLPSKERGGVRILVPGCGLGRLPFEIAQQGFSVQGNEFSLFMLFVSNFILNSATSTNEFSIHPFCHSVSNTRTTADVLREIRIPDVLPSDLAGDADLSMAAGDFTEIYKDEAGQWDCIVTCFFIDTAHNVVQYLEVIRDLLKDGGTWINLGPSLWHFENNASGSIDLPLDEVKGLARRMGFEIANEREIETTYTSNPLSTLCYTYQASFWTATKVAID